MHHPFFSCYEVGYNFSSNQTEGNAISSKPQRKVTIRQLFIGADKGQSILSSAKCAGPAEFGY